MKYKKEYKFKNITFTVIADDKNEYDDQIKHISQFFIPLEDYIVNLNENINITYNVNELMFTKLLEKTSYIEPKLYQTFENQIHSEYTINKVKIYIINTKEYIAIKYDDNNYEILTDGRLKSIRWVFRIIREILVRKNEEKNKLFMHGTGLIIDNKGVLILGNSGSGKTTLASKLLSTNDCQKGFLSNDRIFLDNNNGVATMEYFPIPVVFAMGTVRADKYLNNYFERTSIYEKRIGKSFEDSDDKDKVDIPLTDIPKIYENVILKAVNKVDLIIFSKLDLQFRVETSKYLSSLAREIKLNQTCFTIHDWESLRMQWIHKTNISNDQLIENKILTLKNISDNVPIINLDYSISSKGEDVIKLIKKYY
ncbi:MAG: hypothetical protein PHS24_03965 [Bacilli bacterium]|nr:hypothetical protein [Bacilli bacterium]